MGNEITKTMTLCFLRDGDGRVLLGKKTRKIGAGKWNGLGGGEEKEDKTIEDAARREVWEESGEQIRIGEITSLGFVDFKFPELGEINRVFMFVTSDFTGEPAVNEEMSEFAWFDSDDLPYDNMLEADSHFIPELLKGRSIQGEFIYTKDFELKEFTIEDFKETIKEQ